MPKDKHTGTKKFIRYRMGIGKRLTYTYRIITAKCPDCKNVIEYGQRGRGRLRGIDCSKCLIRMSIEDVVKGRVVRS